jgi:hypothetical protein
MSAGVRMSEIDLIPEDYRHQRNLSRAVRTVGIVVLGLICVTAALSAGLKASAADARAQVRRLEAVAAMINEQRTNIAKLQERRAAIAAETSLLAAMSLSPRLDVLLETVSSAAPPQSLWFDTWQLERLGPVVAAAPIGAETWFVIDAAAAAQQTDTVVRVEMTVSGQAQDHAAIATFVGNLLKVHGMKTVRVQRAARELDESLVAFEVFIVADAEGAAR